MIMSDKSNILLIGGQSSSWSDVGGGVVVTTWRLPSQSINMHCLCPISIIYCVCGRTPHCLYNPLAFPSRIQLAYSRDSQPHRITYSETSGQSVLIKVLLLLAACLNIVCFNRIHQLWKLSLELMLVRGGIMGYFGNNWRFVCASPKHN